MTNLPAINFSLTRQEREQFAGVLVGEFTDTPIVCERLITLAHKFTPGELAFMVMQHLPPSPQRLRPKSISFWAAFADCLGPDYTEAFKRVSIFMTGLTRY